MRHPILSALIASALPLFLFAKKPATPDVLVVSDVLATDAKSVQPEPGKPVYYYLIGGVARDMGGSVAGEPSPDPKLLRAEITGALAGRGFIETKVGGPLPQIAILYSWGNASIDSQDMVDTDAETGESTTSTLSLNSREIFQLVGLDKAQRHLMSSAEQDVMTDAVNHDRLYIFIGAFDFQALRQKKKQLLWRTRMSIDSLRNSLPDAMHVMIASAAPYFARDEEKPVVIDDAARRNPSVRLGETKFLGEVPEKEPKK